MRSNDENRPAADTRFAPVGMGMVMRMKCIRCQKSKPTAGGGRWRGLMCCAECKGLKK